MMYTQEQITAAYFALVRAGQSLENSYKRAIRNRDFTGFTTTTEDYLQNAGTFLDMARSLEVDTSTLEENLQRIKSSFAEYRSQVAELRHSRKIQSRVTIQLYRLPITEMQGRN